MTEKIESDDEAREAVQELSADSITEVNKELFDPIKDYISSCSPLNPVSADIMAGFYSLGSDGIAGAKAQHVDRQDRADTLFLNVTPDASIFGTISYIERAGYNLSRISLRAMETLWEEDGTQYFRSEKGYYATLVFEKSNPTRSLEALISQGCSPAEALDYWATELKNGTGVSTQDWSEERDVSQQAISANRAEARKKISDSV